MADNLCSSELDKLLLESESARLYLFDQLSQKFCKKLEVHNFVNTVVHSISSYTTDGCLTRVEFVAINLYYNW